MAREVTYTDLSRLDALDEASAAFSMDEETFRAFYKRSAPGVWSYLARVTGNSHTADDLLQETFYRFLRAGATHDNEAHRRNSLYRIATNLARDNRRRFLSRPLTGVEGDEVERVAAADSVPQTEQRADFSRAMAQLHPRDRAMLWLAYAEGASHKEIAGVLGLRHSSMKILLFRARRKLADLLRGSPPDQQRGGKGAS